jgi:hypothetical protein
MMPAIAATVFVVDDDDLVRQNGGENLNLRAVARERPTKLQG